MRFQQFFLKSLNGDEQTRLHSWSNHLYRFLQSQIISRYLLPEVLSFLYIEIKNISNVNRHIENVYLCHFV